MKPDSGWSWVIAFSCCFINVMMFGMSRLSGVLLVATRKHFLVTRKEAAFPYTFAQMMRNLVSPIAGLLSQKYGVRSVTCAGALISAFGIAVCFAAKDTLWINIFWGGVFGIGYGLGNILLPLVINQYFDKHRATASGISYSGACFGSFILPSLTDKLLNEYGLNGTFLILSALVLHCVPVAMLLKKPPFVIEKSNTAERDVHNKIIQGNLPMISSDIKSKKDNISNNFAYNNPSFNESENSKENTTITSTVLCSTKETPANFILQIKNMTNADDKIKTKIQENPTTAKICLRLCTHPLFIFITFTTFIFGYTFVCMVTCIVDFAADVGISNSAANYVLMAFSIGDFIGRVGLGWITDRKYMTKSAFTATCFLLQGVTATAVSLSAGLRSLMAAMFLYGVFEGGIILILPLLIDQYVEANLQSLALPSSNVLIAAGCLLVPVVIGIFRESLGSYNGMYYHVGILSWLCAVCWYCIPCIQRYRDRRRQNR